MLRHEGNTGTGESLEAAVASQARALASGADREAALAPQNAKLATTVEKLTGFLDGIGIDPAVVLDGPWVVNASKLPTVKFDEGRAGELLGGMPEQERASVLSVARKLVRGDAMQRLDLRSV